MAKASYGGNGGQKEVYVLEILGAFLERSDQGMHIMYLDYCLECIVSYVSYVSEGTHTYACSYTK